MTRSTKCKAMLALAGLAIVSPVVAAPAKQPASATHSEAAERAEAIRQINAAIDILEKGYATSDPELLAEPYVRTDQYVLFDVTPPMVEYGWKSLDDKNRLFFSLIDGNVIMKWTDRYIDVDHRLAYFRGIAHFTGKYKDGRPLNGDFRHTLIFQKVGDKWLIIHEHGSIPNQAIALTQ